MKLTLEGLQDKEGWGRAGIALPTYDVEVVRRQAAEAPVWVHLGIGNIFRAFLGSIADQLLTESSLQAGLVCVECYDYEVVDRIYRPYDNLALNVILNNDGTQDLQVLAPFAEAIQADPAQADQMARLKAVFAAPSLQMVSFTITEKGYALHNAAGEYTGAAVRDFDNGPDGARSAMAIVTAMLYERYQHGAAPIALVSMDNCSHNGERLREAVCTVAREWIRRGYCVPEFESYVADEELVAFPWTMIDKITPRPDPVVAQRLTALGVEGMEIVTTDKKTFIAPYCNAERAQYLVVEDHFPNGRPALEHGGVYMTDRETVNKSERMKVTVCLNPIHTALCTYACMLRYDLFADAIGDKDLAKLAHQVGYGEGMKVVPDPGILSPEAFLDEVVDVRMSNPYLGDTSQRIAVDISQMVGIRFGETIKSFVQEYGTAASLVGIPLAIAGWLRYLLAIDDEGEAFELAPDPMIPELQAQLSGITFGDPDSVGEQLHPILSNERIFGVNLYDAGIGTRIEEMFREEIAGPHAVRAVLERYLGE